MLIKTNVGVLKYEPIDKQPDKHPKPDFQIAHTSSPPVGALVLVSPSVFGVISCFSGLLGCAGLSGCCI